MPRVPHLVIVVFVTFLVIAGYAVFSVWAVNFSADKAMIGDVGGTWKTWAALGVGFWLGSSSGGKARDVSQIQTAADDGKPQTTKGS